MYTCYIQSFKTLASLCSWGGWFKSYLFENPWHVFAWCGSFDNFLLFLQQLFRIDNVTAQIFVNAPLDHNKASIVTMDSIVIDITPTNPQRGVGKNQYCKQSILVTFFKISWGRKCEMTIFNRLFKQSCACFKSYDNFHGGDIWKFSRI